MGLLDKIKEIATGEEKGQQQQENKLLSMTTKALLKILKAVVKFVVSHLGVFLIPVIIALIIIAIIYMGLTNLSIQSSEQAGSSINAKTSFKDGEIDIDPDVYDEIRNRLREDGVNPDSIYLGRDYDYLEKMVKATVVTNYPDTGKGDLRGAVKVYRHKVDAAAPIRLTYIDKTTFDLKFNNKSLDIVDYFYVDDNMNIVIAKYNKSTITNEAGVTTVEYYFDIVKLPYQNRVSQYAMPFEFLFVLMIQTLNPEYVAAVADLAINHTTIDYTIMDYKSISTKDTEHTYDERITVKEDGTEISKNETSYSSKTKEVYEINNVLADITAVKTWIYEMKIPYEKTPLPEVPIKVNEITITKEENEAYADTYVSVPSVRYEIEEVPDDFVGPPGYITINIETITETYNRQDFIEEYLQESKWVSQPNKAEKEINPDLFLGLWRNETGKYVPGAKHVSYEDDGTVVMYTIPDTGFQNSPASSIIEYVSLFFYQLSATSKTQGYENLMRYVLYIYTGIDYGITSEEDVEALLNIFNRADFSHIGAGGSIDLYAPRLTREQFIAALENYSAGNDYNSMFKANAGLIYDICTTYEYAINPELVVVLAQAEGNYRVTRNKAFNYWGYGCSNDTSAGTEFTSLEDGIKSLARSIHSYANPSSSHYSAILKHYEDRQTSGCDPLGYGLPGTLSGWQSRYSGIFVHGDPNDMSHETTQRLNPNHAWGKEIYKTYEEFVTECVNKHPVGSETTPWERGQYTAYQVRQKISIWNSIFGGYGTLGGAGGSSSPVANGSKQEKLNWLFPDGIPTTPTQVGKYIAPVQIDLTKKDGTKYKSTIYLHKAMHQDVQDIFKTIQDAGFVVYEHSGGYVWKVMSSGNPSQHAYGIAIDINVRENYMPGIAGEFWRPYEDPYSFPRDGVVVQSFKAKGWGWGGDFNPSNPQDYMHFSFTGW